MLAGQLGADARHVGEQGRAGRINIHADVVDDTLDHAIQGMREGDLIDIVLVETHADGSGDRS